MCLRRAAARSVTHCSASTLRRVPVARSSLNAMAALPTSAVEHNGLISIQTRAQSSTTDDTGALEIHEGDERGGHTGSEDQQLSTEAMEAEGEEETHEEFDVEEAALQEIHDLARAVKQHRVYCQSGQYGKKEQIASGQIFNEMMSKLLKLLTPAIVKRMILSANRPKYSVRPSNQTIVGERLFVERARYSPETSPFPRLMMHAPHELHSLRSDLPKEQIEYSTSLRDQDTLDILRWLCFQPRAGLDAPGAAIERKLLESTRDLGPEFRLV